MKISIPRHALREAMQLASAAAGDGKVKPILACAKIVADAGTDGSNGDGKCTIEATDTESGVRATVAGVTVEDEGSVVVPVAMMTGILREGDSEDTITIDGDRAGIVVEVSGEASGSGSRFDLPGQDPASFPAFPAFDESGPHHQIQAGELLEMSKRANCAVSTTDHQKMGSIVRGIHWDLQKDSASLISCDGRLCSVIDGAAKSIDDHKTSRSAVTTRKAMALIEKSKFEPDETVRVTFQKAGFYLSSGRVVIYSQLMAGQFPDMRRLTQNLDKGNPMTVTAGRLFEVIRQSCLMNDEETRSATITCKKGVLSIKSNGSQRGQFNSSLPVAGGEKAEMVLSLDTFLLRDILAVIPRDAEVVLTAQKSPPRAVISEGTRGNYALAEVFRAQG